jgi:hypothetical protein
MMGSRGDPATMAVALAGLASAMPPQVSGLMALEEFVSLLKAADKILPAAIKDLRAVEAMARGACDDLKTATAEYERNQSELQTERERITSDRKAADIELARAREENHAAMQVQREGAAKDIADQRAAADAEIAGLRAEAQKVMDAARAKEAAVHKHVAELTALARE